MDLTKVEDVVKHMKQSTGEEDWSRRCKEVKSANGGYPDFWWREIVQSGVYQEKFGPNEWITVLGIDSDGNVEKVADYNPVTGERVD